MQGGKNEKGRIPSRGGSVQMYLLTHCRPPQRKPLTEGLLTHSRLSEREHLTAGLLDLFLRPHFTTAGLTKRVRAFRQVVC